ncbi:S24 family peptidase [Deinococcus multiflagellatus]|uniref:S24 family peptidase n=2 Tax=Deinococcus multiflagellatus TaxID=1656887 RepID=A0ABW1ZGP0_9DEIO
MRRLQLGKGQEDIVAEAGDLMTQGWVSDVERGKVDLRNAGFSKVVALATALGWTLPQLQKETGIDLGIAPLTLVGEGSADVYPMQAARDLENLGLPVSHDAVAPGIKQPLLLQLDSDEMVGTGPASIRPGSVLHIDRAERELSEGRVYVIADEAGVHCRLYAQTRLGAVFRAENRTHEDIPAGDVQVIGKVVTVATDYSPNLN